MMSLPTSLQPFAHFRQFITYILRPTDKPGKMDKIPCDWRTGEPANAHDPAIWTDYDTAYAVSGGKVGFVFTDHDPFWFLDIDNCLLPSGWSPLAQELCAEFAGAAVEVSMSGTGLHIFGTGAIPRHKSRGPAGSGLELYHTGRFVALGKPETLIGSAATDCTAALQRVIPRYFARVENEQVDPSWTSGPCEGWNGPKDDDELIRRLRNSKSAAGVFGSKATAGQLWDADISALGKAYPDANGRPYDASSADAALAQHLAFWTGKDCERMKRLMQQSKLSRDKYDREDYLPRTILQAVGKQVDVCHDKPPELPSANKNTSGPQDVVGETYLNPEMQKILFDHCCYVADINKIILPGGHTYGHDQFDAMLGGYSFVMDYATTKVSKSAWDAFTKSQAVRFDKAHTSSFRPDKAPGEIWNVGNERVVNSYWPINVDARKGNPAPFLAHLSKILPDRNDQAIILAYMAAIVQHRGVKFQWCPLIQGVPGNGKSLLSRVLIEAVGEAHSHLVTNSQEISEKYNDWVQDKVFIGVEDVYVPHERKEILEILKPMITSERLEIRGMGKDKRTRRVCANFIMNSNYKDAVKKNKDDRRFAIFFCPQQTKEDLERDGMTGDYFPNLYSWLRRDGYAILADYLATYKIPDELNPATNCHRAPETSSTEEAIAESLGTLEQEIVAAIEEERQGFRNGWISSHFLNMLMQDAGIKMPRNKRRDILLEMGYVYHPGLHNGQVNNPVQPDGCKPRLFIRKGSGATQLRGGDVAKQYSDDQTSASPFKVVPPPPLQSRAA